MVGVRRLFRIIAPHFAVTHCICLRKLAFVLLRATSAFRSLLSLQPTQNPLELQKKVLAIKMGFISDIWIVKTRLCCLTCLNISYCLEIDWKIQNCPKLHFSVLKIPLQKFLIRQNSNTAYNVTIISLGHKRPI